MSNVTKFYCFPGSEQHTSICYTDDNQAVDQTWNKLWNGTGYDPKCKFDMKDLPYGQSLINKASTHVGNNCPMSSALSCKLVSKSDPQNWTCTGRTISDKNLYEQAGIIGGSVVGGATAIIAGLARMGNAFINGGEETGNAFDATNDVGDE